MTTNIKEKITGRVVAIEGDIFAAMKACVNRNKQFRESGISGEWKLEMPFHIEPHEYERALASLPEAKTAK